MRGEGAAGGGAGGQCTEAVSNKRAETEAAGHAASGRGQHLPGRISLSFRARLLLGSQDGLDPWSFYLSFLSEAGPAGVWLAGWLHWPGGVWRL